jgi:hypothetical protein
LPFILSSNTTPWLLILSSSLSLFRRLKRWSWFWYYLLCINLSINYSLTPIFSYIPWIIYISLVFKNYPIIIVSRWWLRRLSICAMMISSYWLIYSSCILVKRRIIQSKWIILRYYIILNSSYLLRCMLRL